MAVITLIVVALLLMLGILTPKKASARVGVLVASLLFMPVILGVLKSSWSASGPLMKLIVLVVGAPVAFFFLVRTIFGREVYSHLVGALLHDFVRFVLVSFRSAFRAVFRL